MGFLEKGSLVWRGYYQGTEGVPALGGLKYFTQACGVLALEPEEGILKYTILVLLVWASILEVSYLGLNGFSPEFRLRLCCAWQLPP